MAKPEFIKKSNDFLWMYGYDFSQFKEKDAERLLYLLPDDLKSIGVGSISFGVMASGEPCDVKALVKKHLSSIRHLEQKWSVLSAELDTKVDDLSQRGFATEAADALLFKEEMDTLITKCKSGELSPSMLSDQSKHFIQDAKKALSGHRGWADFFFQVAQWVLSFVSVGAYPIWRASQLSSNQQSLFYHPPTASEVIVNSVEEMLFDVSSIGNGCG